MRKETIALIAVSAMFATGLANRAYAKEISIIDGNRLIDKCKAAGGTVQGNGCIQPGSKGEHGIICGGPTKKLANSCTVYSTTGGRNEASGRRGVPATAGMKKS